MVGLALGLFQFGYLELIAHAAPAQADGHFVAKEPVEVGDAGDGLDLEPALLAPSVKDVELGPHQATITIVGHGADQLGAADAEGEALVGPGLGDEAGAGGDGTHPCVFYDKKVVRPEGGMGALEEVADPRPRPGRQAPRS